MWRSLEKLEEGVVAFLLAAMTVVTFAQVIARYIFNYSFVWALELVSILFAWLIFIGMSYGVRVGSHIGMDAVVKLLGEKLGRIVTIVATLLCIAYSIIIFIGSWHYVNMVYDLGNYAQDLPIPVWVPRLALPVGFALLTARFSQVLYRTITGESTKLLVDEAEEALKLQVNQVDDDGRGKP